MSDKPQKPDPVEKKLDSKEQKAPSSSAELARSQLVQDSLENRTDWTDGWKKAFATKIEETNQQLTAPQKETEQRKEAYTGTTYTGTAQSFEGSPNPQTMLDMAQVRVQSGQPNWPDVQQSATPQGAKMAPETPSQASGNGDSGQKKNDEKICTEADSPKVNLDEFPEFFRKHYEQKPEQQQPEQRSEQRSDPREEQRQEQREMREAANSGQATPQAETPHPASVDMWTKQAPAAGSWEAIESIYGKNVVQGKFDNQTGGQAELGGTGKPGQAGHSSGGLQAHDGGDHAATQALQVGKPDPTSGAGNLGRADSDAVTGRADLGGVNSRAELGGSNGRAELPAASNRTEQGSFEPARSDAQGRHGSNQSFPQDDTASGGRARFSDSSSQSSSRNERGGGEVKFERGDVKQSSDLSPIRSVVSSNDVLPSRASDDRDRTVIRPAELTAVSPFKSEEKSNRYEKDPNSREIDLPPQVRFVPENKETNQTKVVAPEQQNMSLTFARNTLSENKNIEPTSINLAKKPEGMLLDKSAPISLTELRTASIFRDFRAGESNVAQDFKSNTDGLKLQALLDGKLTTTTTVRTAGESSAQLQAGRGMDLLGLTTSSLTARDLSTTQVGARADQTVIFSAKLTDVQASARNIDILLGSKSEAGSRASDPNSRELSGARGDQATLNPRGVKVPGLRDELSATRFGADAILAGRGDRNGFEIVGATDRVRAERGQRGDIEDLKELRALLDKSSKFGEKRYLTGVEIALAAAIAAVAVAKTRNEKELAQSQVELATKQLRELIDDDDVDVQTPDTNDDDAESLNLPWQADSSGAERKRPEYMVAHNDTLQNIAELFYNDSAVAWLIADINRAKISEFYEDGKRIIEMRSRQAIELPLWSEVNDFLRNRSEASKKTEIVCIVSETEVDRELLDSFLSTVIGISAKGEGTLSNTLNDITLYGSNNAVPAGSFASGRPTALQSDSGALTEALARTRVDGFHYGPPALAGAMGGATTALALEENQLTVLLSIGRKLLPSFNNLKKAGLNLQSYVSGRDWKHGGLGRNDR